MRGVGLALRVVAGWGVLWCARAWGQCPMEWARGYEVLGVNGTVYAYTVFDDGRGPAMYVGGNFTYAGDAPIRTVARWDGQGWAAVGEPDGPCECLAVHDDGSGPALYAGLRYGVHRWDGQRWNLVGNSGTYGASLLFSFDDGAGPALYVGGAVPGAIRRWDGQSWSVVGGGMWIYNDGAYVAALTVFDDGQGPKLYAGGYFSRAGNAAAANIARWDGSAWSALPGGGCDREVRALIVHDDGRGPALIAGGRFQHAGAVAAGNVAKWNGAAWSPLGEGLGQWIGYTVETFAVFDDGTGSALYAGGTFYPPAPQHFARWDGAHWSSVGGGADNTVHALGVWAPPGGSPGLYVGGELNAVGDVGCAYIGRWDGQRFAPMGSGRGLPAESWAAYWFDDGGGPALYVAGYFGSAGSVACRGLARWTDTGWTALPPIPLLYSRLYALTAFDDGTGPALYVGGPFVAKWDGNAWRDLTGPTEGDVRTFCVYDDGGGPALYAGGTFTRIGVTQIYYIAKWDGFAWSPLAGGLDDWVRGMAVFDAGQGPELYVCGDFVFAYNPARVTVNHVARWNGQRWSPVGGGIQVGGDSTALLSYDDGSGPALYMGGGFSNVGGTPANNVVRWTGSQWQALAAGTNGSVMALAAFDDGTGAALYATGPFTAAGGQPALEMARWKNGGWSAVGDGITGLSYGLTVGLAGSRPALIAVGHLVTAGGHASSNLAFWRCVANWNPGDTNCDGVVDWRDIDPFVLALSDPGEYERRYSNCIRLNGDCNGDGLVDFNDITPLVELLGRAGE